MCKVLNKHAVGVPAGAVYIGRGGKWGNPFRIGPDGDQAVVIAKHELLRSIGELRGKDLVCFWCAPAAYTTATSCCARQRGARGAHRLWRQAA